MKRSDAAWPDERDYRTIFAVQHRESEPARGWYVVPVPVASLDPGSHLRVEVEVEAEAGDVAAGAITLFGDYPATKPVYHGPSPLSPQLRADNSLSRYIAVGDYRMRRLVPVPGSGRSTFHHGRDCPEIDLSPVPGLQQGRYRILLVLTYRDAQLIL